MRESASRDGDRGGLPAPVHLELVGDDACVSHSRTTTETGLISGAEAGSTKLADTDPEEETVPATASVRRTFFCVVALAFSISCCFVFCCSVPDVEWCSRPCSVSHVLLRVLYLSPNTPNDDGLGVRRLGAAVLGTSVPPDYSDTRTHGQYGTDLSHHEAYEFFPHPPLLRSSLATVPETAASTPLSLRANTTSAPDTDAREIEVASTTL